MTTVAEKVLRSNDVLVNYLRKFADKMETYEGDDLQYRRMLKKCYIQALIIIKLHCRKIKEIYQRGQYSSEVYKELRLFYGNLVAELLYQMDHSKIRLNENQYRAVFNISYEDWKANYHRKKPDGTMDIVFVQKLSEEPFIDFMVDAMLDELMKNPKAKQQVDNYMRYELGLPF